jgi:hypothetical protein
MRRPMPKPSWPASVRRSCDERSKSAARPSDPSRLAPTNRVRRHRRCPSRRHGCNHRRSLAISSRSNGQRCSGSSQVLELLLSAGLVIGLDQMTKRVIARKVAPGRSIWAWRRFRIRHAVNENLAGVLHRRWALLCLWLGLAGYLVLLAHRGYLFAQGSAKVALRAALGGPGVTCTTIFAAGP